MSENAPAIEPSGFDRLKSLVRRELDKFKSRAFVAFEFMAGVYITAIWLKTAAGATMTAAQQSAALLGYGALAGTATAGALAGGLALNAFAIAGGTYGAYLFYSFILEPNKIMQSIKKNYTKVKDKILGAKGNQAAPSPSPSPAVEPTPASQTPATQINVGNDPATGKQPVVPQEPAKGVPPKGDLEKDFSQAGKKPPEHVGPVKPATVLTPGFSTDDQLPPIRTI